MICTYLVRVPSVLILCANLVRHEVRAGSFLGNVPIELIARKWEP